LTDIKFITQDGRAAAVLITPEQYDRMHEREEFLAAVDEGLADVAAGRVHEDDDIAADHEEKSMHKRASESTRPRLSHSSATAPWRAERRERVMPDG
jgi:predicted transcriptional regulator